MPSPLRLVRPGAQLMAAEIGMNQPIFVAALRLVPISAVLPWQNEVNSSRCRRLASADFYSSRVGGCSTCIARSKRFSWPSSQHHFSMAWVPQQSRHLAIVLATAKGGSCWLCPSSPLLQPVSSSFALPKTHAPGKSLMNSKPEAQPIHQHGRCAIKPRSAGYVRR